MKKVLFKIFEICLRNYFKKRHTRTPMDMTDIKIAEQQIFLHIHALANI